MWNNNEYTLSLDIFSLKIFNGGIIKMFYISEIYTNEPKEFKNNLQEKVYKCLNELNINFERVDTEEAITMEDCIEINNKLNMKMVKTLFLCNRQKTNFYL